MPETATLRGNVPAFVGGTRVILVSTKLDHDPPQATLLVGEGDTTPVVVSAGDIIELGGICWRVDEIAKVLHEAPERWVGPGRSRVHLSRA